MSDETEVVQPEGLRVVSENGEELNKKSEEAQAAQAAKPSVLRVGIVGDNALARSTEVAFNTKSAETVRVDGADDVDSLIDSKPALVFVCQDIPLLSNDTLDDADFLNTVNKLVKQAGAGICIRSTLNIETIERLIRTLSFEVFNAKVTYMPEFSNPEDLGDVLSSEYSMVGGDGKAIQAFMELITHTSYYSSQTLLTGSVFEVAYAKLAVAGFKAVKQTYFNQLHDTILDLKNANPTVVRRMIEKSPDLVDRTTMIPTFVRAQAGEDVSYKQARAFGGEYLNRDVRMFVGMTDKMPIVDEAVNFKNLKGE